MQDNSPSDGVNRTDGNKEAEPLTIDRYAQTDIGLIERASLAFSLNLIGQRLSALETRLEAKTHHTKLVSPIWSDILKILFGGWPAFGVLFVLLFYGPVRDAINAIPDKVKNADEIGLMGVSLKSTIRAEAEKSGSLQLSETLPTLSPIAVEFMLRGARDGYNPLVSYIHENGAIKTIWLPNEQALRILDELEAARLLNVQLSNGAADNSVADLRNAIVKFRRQHPAREEKSDRTNEMRLDLTSVERSEPPRYSWRFTDLGKNAVNVILKAVSAQLSPQPHK